MKSGLDLIKFTLTDEMAKEMISINNIKKELVNKRLEYKYLNSDNKSIKELEKEIKILEEKFNESKKMFIILFQKNNIEEIKEYLSIIDKQEI